MLKLDSKVLLQIYRKIRNNVYKNVMIENKSSSSSCVGNSEEMLAEFRKHRNTTTKQFCLSLIEAIVSDLLQNKRNEIYFLAKKYFSIWDKVWLYFVKSKILI